MKKLIIAAMAVFCMVACEDTNTSTQTTEDQSGTTFTGASNEADASDIVLDEVVITAEDDGTSENNETNTVPSENEEVTPEQETEPTEVNPEEEPVEVETEPTEDEVTLDDLTADEFANIEILRDNIFQGLDIGHDLYVTQVGLALEDLGLASGYEIVEGNQDMPEVSDCPYVEFYNNVEPVTGFACEYLVDQARSEAYSKLFATLASSREGYDPDLSENDFWFEQGAISGLEQARVNVRVDIKAKQICNQNPTPVKSSEEKGNVVGRQHFVNSMNNWLSTNGYAADYPVMSDPIEVCEANESLLDPVFNDAMNSISQAMEQNPLCDGYVPVDSEDEIMYAQAQSDYSNALKVGVQDEFALAAVKIFKVVPCNVSDPIIIDLNNNGRFDITTVERGVNFSMFGERSVATSWLSGDGFLFYDFNENGVADDGTEFFGTNPRYESAFIHLATFDSNKDGMITAKDERFGDLYIWLDRNYDGVSTVGEVTALSKTEITSIPLDAGMYKKVSTRVNGSRVKSTVRVTTGQNRVVLFGDVDLRSSLYPKLRK